LPGVERGVAPRNGQSAHPARAKSTLGVSRVASNGRLSLIPLVGICGRASAAARARCACAQRYLQRPGVERRRGALASAQRITLNHGREKRERESISIASSCCYMHALASAFDQRRIGLILCLLVSISFRAGACRPSRAPAYGGHALRRPALTQTRCAGFSPARCIARHGKALTCAHPAVKKLISRAGQHRRAPHDGTCITPCFA
jgi:hypothetical protein